jgi:replicative DNA helicase
MPKKKKNAFSDKIPPQNLEAERALLGCMLIDEEAKIRSLETIKEDFFYDQSHKKIFSAISILFEKGENCDLVTLTNQLKSEGRLEEVGGVEALSEIVENLPTAANVDEYSKIVKDKYILRALISNATKIISEAQKDKIHIEALLDEAESLIFEISENRIEKEAYAMKDLIKDNIEEIEKIHNKRGTVTGLPTGFIDLDEKTTGLHPSDFVIIASRPSMGKTSLGCNIILNITSGVKKAPVLFFSLEMSKEQLVKRMLCCEAKIDLMKLRQGMLSDKDMGNLLLVAGRLEKMPIFIDDSPSLSAFELRARARRLKAREDIQLIIVDYLQLMKSKNRTENRQQEISDISSSLKALAKELNIPVIAISQLSRAPELREGKKPQLSDLRESGSIEQDADLVLLLYREEFYHQDDEEAKNIAEVNIAKQRNGPTGVLRLTFLKEFTRFENYRASE